MLEVGMKINGWDDQRFWEELENNGYKYQGIITEKILELLIGQQEIINYDDGEEQEKTNASVTLKNDTEKAIKIVIEFTTRIFYNGEIEDELSGKYSYWLPKSQIKIEQNKIIVPKWLAKEKDIVKYGNKVSVITKLK